MPSMLFGQGAVEGLAKGRNIGPLLDPSHTLACAKDGWTISTLITSSVFTSIRTWVRGVFQDGGLRVPRQPLPSPPCNDDAGPPRWID